MAFPATASWPAPSICACDPDEGRYDAAVCTAFHDDGYGDCETCRHVRGCHLQLPLLHSGGSGPNLDTMYSNAYEALYAAVEALAACVPHGRDYYPLDRTERENGNAHARALSEHRHRLAAVENALAEINAHRHYIEDAARRKEEARGLHSTGMKALRLEPTTTRVACSNTSPFEPPADGNYRSTGRPRRPLPE